MTPVINTCAVSIVKSSLEPAKALLESLKRSDEFMLLNFEQEHEILQKKILSIDPLLLGKPRYSSHGKIHKLFCDIRYRTSKLFATKVNMKLQRLEQLNQSILSLKSSISQKATEIQRLGSEILRLQSLELERQSQQKAHADHTLMAKKLYEDLHEARKASIFETARTSTQSMSNAALLLPATIVITPAVQEALPQYEKSSQIEPILTQVREPRLSKTYNEMFVDSICDELMLLEVPDEFSRLLTRSLFPEVSTFVKTANGSYEINFKGNFQFNGSLSGVKATIHNPLNLKIQIDLSKKRFLLKKKSTALKQGLVMAT